MIENCGGCIISIMRFKKGSNVEVLRKKEVPSGSWWCAEIICRDGHKYTVRYGVEAANDETVVERVHRTAIRPCPPPVEVTESWVPGDIVEVFDNFSWKMATISEVLGNKNFLVRIVGSCREYKVGKLEVRVRQFWQDDKWVVVGKVIASELFASQFLHVTYCSFVSKILSSVKDVLVISMFHPISILYLNLIFRRFTLNFYFTLICYNGYGIHFSLVVV